MKSQKSFQHKQATLYLVATPIGNLEDMTIRALRILKEVDIIAAEDTRNTKNLCNYFDIQTKLVSYHEHNQESGGFKILSYLEEGKSVALVSDAACRVFPIPVKTSSNGQWRKTFRLSRFLEPTRHSVR